MSGAAFPINAAGLTFYDRDDMFRYIVANSSAYYAVVDVVRQNENEALILSTTDDDPYFNYVVHKDGALADCITRNKPVFKEFNRTPIVYISPASVYYGKNTGLKKFATDAYMFLEDEDFLQNLHPDDSVEVKLCENENLFTDLFAREFSDPNGIYGVESKAIINGMRKFFHPAPAGFSHFALVVYKNRIPAGSVAAVYNGDFLLVEGLGTLPEFRKRGLGAALMADIVRRAQNLGVKAITLSTEYGTYNEKYYEKIGFKTKFYSIYYKA